MANISAETFSGVVNQRLIDPACRQRVCHLLNTVLYTAVQYSKRFRNRHTFPFQKTRHHDDWR